MSREPASLDATLRTLAEVRRQTRAQAQAALSAAKHEVEAQQLKLSEARTKWRKLVDAETRDEARTRAGTLQRRAECRVALSGARADASQAVKQALANLSSAQVTLERAEQALREAHVDERVVERHIDQKAVAARRAAERLQDEDNDELGQRR